MQRARVLALALLFAAAAALWSAAPAGAQQQQPGDPDGVGTDLFITIGARVCDNYTDIRANKQRNNIQESLRDLGLDTNYQTGELVNPVKEQEGQPNCRPLPGWSFTFGNGISGTRVTGPWGSLSIVNAPFSADVTTIESIPDRDGNGTIKPGTTIAGATTIELSDGMRQAGAYLTLQGGTITDPVLNRVFPGQYAFGALRCSDDNLNGDNVEFARVTQGLEHIYCFAYYVQPPPTSGTIIITKEVSRPENATQSFRFVGNISYTENNDFTLKVTDGRPASATFYRGETVPGDPSTLWTVREEVAAGWSLTGLACSSQLGSTTVRNPARPEEVVISLRPGDTVRCTFTDALDPMPGELLISKITTGGTGRFPFTVRDVDGEVVLSTHATTQEPGVAVVADGTPVKLDAGGYSVGENLPDVEGGRWRQTAAGCNARIGRRTPRARRRDPPPIEVQISEGSGAVCAFENRFVPGGAIAIAKTTLGAAGSASFTVTPLADPPRELVKTATTSGSGDTALARGDSTRQLPLGRYLIREHSVISERAGDWQLVSLSCGPPGSRGRLRAFEQGSVVVELTETRPLLVCRFVNAFTGPPGPDTTPNPGAPGGETDLIITKRAVDRRVNLGQIAAFAITVRNAGSLPAEDVVVADRPDARGQLVSARASRGGCNERTPVSCRIGTLAPGERATFRVRVRAVDVPLTRNLAVVGSATPETRLSNNATRARVRVASNVSGECPPAAASRQPLARAAC